MKNLIDELSDYFDKRSDVAFAFLFGSTVRGTSHSESDLDVAVYFFPNSGELEIEDDVYYDAAEDEIWADIDKISGRETDLLVLNRAPAGIGYTAVTEGTELSMKDRSWYWRYILCAGRIFEEYGDFVRSFAEIKARSLSLSAVDKARLIRTIDFLKTEMKDLPQFRELSFEAYSRNSALRRNVERWIENLVNAAIDISKIIISSEKQQMPQTYRETVQRLVVIDEFPEMLIETLAKNVRLRNILAHEYLDIRFKHILRFTNEAEKIFTAFIGSAEQYLENHG